MNSRYIVMEAGAKRVGKFGNYIRVAVVELDPSFEGRPTMISERAKGVKRIVRLWDQQYLGKTNRCEAARARCEAAELCARLNCPLTNFIDAVDGKH